jgi:hypothetical protein
MRTDLKIRQIVEQMQGISYEFNDWTRANVTLDFKALPVCLYILPVSGRLNFKNGFVRDNPNAMIAFLDKAELDFEGSENEVTVERMKQHAVEFISLANRSGQFKPLPENVPYSVVYDKLDVNLTGIVLSVTLEELQGECSPQKKQSTDYTD